MLGRSPLGVYGLEHLTCIWVIALWNVYAPPVGALDLTGTALSTIMSRSLICYLRLELSVLSMNRSALLHLLSGESGQAFLGWWPDSISLGLQSTWSMGSALSGHEEGQPTAHNSK